MGKFALVISLAITLAACAATGPAFVPSAQPAEDQALIYLYRVNAIWGAWVPVKIEVDGKDSGRLANNSYASLYVPAGGVKLSAIELENLNYSDSNRIFVTASVAAGSTYYFRISQTKEGNIVTTRLQRVSSETGLGDLKTLRRSETVK